MNNKKMFEVATRNKFRFPFRGLISVEDLWDLSLQSLDSIFKSLNAQVEIVKYIVSVKLEEENARLKAKDQKEKK